MKPAQLEKLENALGKNKVYTDEGRLDEKRHDYSVLNKLDDMQGRGAPRPGCIVAPSSTQDVVTTVNICRENKITIIPFGLGSGVCCGIVASPDAVLLDLSGMKKIKKIDTRNLLATFEAGVRGSDAEAAVVKEGMIIGHYPQSMDVSSVGGWVATKSSGQFSTAYGNIENIVKGLKVVLPNGEIFDTPVVPRSSTGPELRELFIGSEGTLGIITEVTLALHWRPEKQDYSAFYAPNMDKGIEFQRFIVQSGWTPPVMRQYDPPEVERLFPDYVHGNDVLIIMVHEGTERKVKVEIEEIDDIAKDVGCEKAPVSAVIGWLEHRNTVPTFEEYLEQGIIVDTVEIAASWDKIGTIYTNTVASLQQIDNMRVASAHSSHSYRTGLNLYFTFAAQPDDPENMSSVYLDSWRRIMESTMKDGGTISHHHGIGRIRKPYMSAEIGETGVEILRSLKATLDPENIMNPSVLIPSK
ncbi:MAG: FAD-binding oxidoreductase [Deltaproteobacteria bacterium]|nr:FAD-binding oxidoreductase [Deltaproteobacteria bacterium]